MDDSKRDTDLDWESRVLCSDESCIGVIGPDGRCKECGLPYQGELPQAPPGGPEVETPEHPGTDEAEPVETAADLEDDPAHLDAGLDADQDDEWAKRKLCRDESCIGVIGPDGRCKECGKPY